MASGLPPWCGSSCWIRVRRRGLRSSLSSKHGSRSAETILAILLCQILRRDEYYGRHTGFGSQKIQVYPVETEEPLWRRTSFLRSHSQIGSKLRLTRHHVSFNFSKGEKGEKGKRETICDV